MNRRNTRNTRDLGLGGAGKGDAPRTIFNAAWRARFELINWSDICQNCGGTGKQHYAVDYEGGAREEICMSCVGQGIKTDLGFERDGVNRLIKQYK